MRLLVIGGFYTFALFSSQEEEVFARRLTHILPFKERDSVTIVLDPHPIPPEWELYI
jgi:hypothetical protein